MDTGRYHFGDAVKSELSIDEWVARENLKHINAGPDGLRSMQRSQCKLSVKEHKDSRTPHNKMNKLEAAMKDSPLFRLDEKVRKTIYAYAMTYQEPIPIRKHSMLNAWYDERGERLVRETWHFTPALLRTCCFINQEASSSFYANNTFKATITNSDISEITDWVNDTEDADLSEVNELVICIEPTSFADLLDISTGQSICQQARVLANALSKTGISRPQIDLPKLKSLDKDAALMGFDVQVAEQLRSRWVLEIGYAFKKVDEDNSLVKKMKTMMIQAKQAGFEKVESGYEV